MLNAVLASMLLPLTAVLATVLATVLTAVLATLTYKMSSLRLGPRARSRADLVSVSRSFLDRLPVVRSQWVMSCATGSDIGETSGLRIVPVISRGKSMRGVHAKVCACEGACRCLQFLSVWAQMSGQAGVLMTVALT